MPDLVQGDHVDITKENFQAMLPSVKEALSECQFFSFDCEMTGLTLDGHREDFLDDIFDRYQKTSTNVSAFLVTQLGISCFKPVHQLPHSVQQQTTHASATPPAEAVSVTPLQTSDQELADAIVSSAAEPSNGSTPNPQPSEQLPPSSNSCSAASEGLFCPTYVASTFNFYIFPASGDVMGGNSCKFTCDADSLLFLSNQGFDFNKFVASGVPYLPAKIRDQRLAATQKRDTAKDQAPMVLSPADEAFAQAMVKEVTEWAAGSEQTYTLPPYNSFQRRVCYQELAKPQFGMEGGNGFCVTKSEENSNRLMLIRASPEDAVEREAADRERKDREFQEAFGFSAVIEAIRDSGKPAIGHNCWLDVAFVMNKFVDNELPATWFGYKDLCRTWFPGGVYDNKYLAKEHCADLFHGDTSLGNVFVTLTSDNPDRKALEEQLAAAGLGLPRVTHGPGFEKYAAIEAGALAHEAGYDAYMTGLSFLTLGWLMAAKAAASTPLISSSASFADVESILSSALAPCLNRLNLNRSDTPYAALTGADPIVNRLRILNLAGFELGTRAPQLLANLALAGLGRPRSWLYQRDGSFIVEFTEEEFPLARERLLAQFPELRITSWAEFYALKTERQADLHSAILAGEPRRVGGLLSADAAAQNKRPRQEEELSPFKKLLQKACSLLS